MLVLLRNFLVSRKLFQYRYIWLLINYLRFALFGCTVESGSSEIDLYDDYCPSTEAVTKVGLTYVDAEVKFPL